MRNRLESACGRIIKQTFKIASPIKKQIINSNCEVHLYIQNNAIDILKDHGYEGVANFFERYKPYINRGIVWADEDFKSYFHFYDPSTKKGMYGNGDNAMTIATKYYKNTLNFFLNNDIANAMAYFGAACHIVQDITIPQHAKRQLLDNHKQFENYVKYNYKKIKRFKTYESPIVYSSIEQYIDYNSRSALNTDYLYGNVYSNEIRFYLTAYKALNISQRTTAGCMIMLYNDLQLLNTNKNLDKSN